MSKLNGLNNILNIGLIMYFVLLDLKLDKLIRNLVFTLILSSSSA